VHFQSTVKAVNGRTPVSDTEQTSNDCIIGSTEGIAPATFLVRLSSARNFANRRPCSEEDVEDIDGAFLVTAGKWTDPGVLILYVTANCHKIIAIPFVLAIDLHGHIILEGQY
jgi:hypothetical protein